MRSKVDPEVISRMLAVAGVATGVVRTDAAAGWLGAQFEGVDTAFEALDFEDEPSGFIVELRRRVRE